MKAWNARDKTYTKDNVDKRIKEMDEKVKDKAVETESATIQNILSEPIAPVGTDLGLKSIITTSDFS